VALCHPISPAHAKTLTENSIRAFINKTTDITSGSIEHTDKDKVLKYLEKHLHKNARFKTTMRYSVPGYPDQENTMSFDREEFMDKIQEAAGTISDYENNVDILSITLSKNKKVATVETRNTETTSMPVSGENGVTTIPMIGTSLCRQIIRMSQNDTIQMFNVSCITDIAFDRGAL